MAGSKRVNKNLSLKYLECNIEFRSVLRFLIKHNRGYSETKMCNSNQFFLSRPFFFLTILVIYSNKIIIRRLDTEMKECNM